MKKSTASYNIESRYERRENILRLAALNGSSGVLLAIAITANKRSAGMMLAPTLCRTKMSAVIAPAIVHTSSTAPIGQVQGRKYNNPPVISTQPVK